MFNNSTLFIGIDLGDRYSVIVILDQDGEVIEESRIPTTQNAFTRKFSSIPTGRDRIISVSSSRESVMTSKLCTTSC